MAYRLVRQIREDEALRESFFELAARVFALPFAAWYQGGYWSERYIPYVVAQGERVVANASANIVDTVWQGRPERYIQIGTVMTDPAHRGQGLARWALEAILTDWRQRCSGIYLYANDRVLDFYPKFGFERAQEYQHTRPVAPVAGDFVRLDMRRLEDRERLLCCYRRSNPYAALPCQGNEGLLMFYCTGPMEQEVYYSRELGLAAVAQREGNTLACHDLFGPPGPPLAEVLARLAAPGVDRAVLGFTPRDARGCVAAPLVQEETLFVLRGKEYPFAAGRVMFPTLSHA